MNDARPVLLPKARKDRLIIKELTDETLVYDLNTDKAHCLNQLAAAVWKNCDGQNSVSDISASLAKETGVAMDEGVIWLALDQLEKFNLLAEVPSTPAVFAGMTRRQLMRNLGVAAVALPVVVSIIAPNPAEAASCGALTGRDPGCACTTSSQCTSGCCKNGSNVCDTSPPSSCH